jgi:uncharacterized protein (TIGR01777 family)
MAETTQTFRSEMPVPASELYAWHGREGAFDRLTPPWMSVRVTSASGTIRPGDAKKLRLGAGPIGINWSLVHRAGTSEFGFIDEQISGPFSAWTHEHRFLPNGAERSVLEDRITYELPLSLVANPIAGRRVQAEMETLFRFRHRRTETDLTRHAGSGVTSPLRVVVSGASGMIGRQLVAFLRTGGHEVFTLVRRPPRASHEIFWDPSTMTIDADSLEGFDAVVHLAGESIAGGRWTKARKASILESRTNGTRLLARTLAQLNQPPKVLVSASGIGYFGDGGQAVLTEASPRGDGVHADVVQVWERETAPASAAGIRVVNPRFGVVLSGNGGLLQQLGRLFKLGGGGQLGNGRQFMSWIAIDDLLGILLESITNPELEGPINAVAPTPVTNADFTRTMASVLRRPAIFRVPAPALRLAAGELADELLLVSQRAEPGRLNQIGFRFDYPTLESALRHELGRPAPKPASQVADAVPTTVLNPGHGD